MVSLIRRKTVYVYVVVMEQELQSISSETQSTEVYGSNRQKDGSITITMRLQPDTIKGFKGCQQKYKFPSLDKELQALLAVYVKYREGKLVAKNK